MIHQCERIATGISLPEEVTTTVANEKTFVRVTLNPPPILIGPREIEQMRLRKILLQQCRDMIARLAVDCGVSCG